MSHDQKTLPALGLMENSCSATDFTTGSENVMAMVLDEPRLVQKDAMVGGAESIVKMLLKFSADRPL
jgi:hypothetical protein